MNKKINNLEFSPLGQKQIEDEIKKVDALYQASRKVKNEKVESDLANSIPKEINHIERSHFTPW